MQFFLTEKIVIFMKSLASTGVGACQAVRVGKSTQVRRHVGI